MKIENDLAILPSHNTSPIMFKNQTIVRPSIEWITVLSPICSFSILLGKAFIIFSIDYM